MSAKLTILCLNKTYFVEELRAAGHNVLTAAIPANFSLRTNEMTSSRRFDMCFSAGDDLAELIRKFPEYPAIDRIVYYDDSEPILHFRGLESCPIPTLFYSVDAHIHANWHSQCCGLFDRVLVAQKDFVPVFGAYNKATFWFPLWAPFVYEPLAKKSIDVCFRGSLNAEHRPKRVAFIERLRKLVSMDAQHADYPPGFCGARIILNEVINNDVNFRVFEALACGGMLLTPKSTNGLLDLFRDGVHLVTYRDDDENDAAEKIRYYLEHEAERAAIARAGRDLVLERHLAKHRAKELEKHLLEMELTERLGGPCGATNLELQRSRYDIAKQAADLRRSASTAAAYILKAAESGQPLWESWVVQSINCAEILFSNAAFKVAEEMLSRLIRRFPGEGALSFALVDFYVRMGDLEQARKVAGTISDQPEVVIAQAPALMKSLFESFRLK